MESWVGPVYFVIFSYWGGPVPYLELFGGRPVKKNTLYDNPPVLCSVYQQVIMKMMLVIV